MVIIKFYYLPFKAIICPTIIFYYLNIFININFFNLCSRLFFSLINSSKNRLDNNYSCCQLISLSKLKTTDKWHFFYNYDFFIVPINSFYILLLFIFLIICTIIFLSLRNYETDPALQSSSRYFHIFLNIFFFFIRGERIAKIKNSCDFVAFVHSCATSILTINNYR